MGKSNIYHLGLVVEKPLPERFHNKPREQLIENVLATIRETAPETIQYISQYILETKKVPSLIGMAPPWDSAEAVQGFLQAIQIAVGDERFDVLVKEGKLAEGQNVALIVVTYK